MHRPHATEGPAVLHVSASGMLGGAERVLLDLLTWQLRTETGPRPRLLTLGTGPLVSAARALGVSATTLQMPRSLERIGEAGQSAIPFMTGLSVAAVPTWRFVRALREHVQSDAPLLVHSHSLKSHLLLALANVPHAPLVWHLHDYLGSRPASVRLLNALSRRCRLAIANSRSVADDIRASLPGVTVMPVLNGVDVAALSAPGGGLELDRLAGMPAAPAGTLRIGLLATFARWKGHRTFLDALARLKDLPVRGYVIGDAVYQTRGSQYSRDELRELAATLGISERVGFTGFVDDRAACLRTLDIAVHASTDPEPFGLAVAEAMAVGRPVVMSPIGGAAELVEPGVDALTHRPGDAGSLADAIRQLASSADLRSGLGQRACQAARERFSISRFGSEVEAAYSHLNLPARAA